MQHSFYCQHCQSSFTHAGLRQEWHDPVYGAAWKIVAPCPICQSQSEEMKAKLTSNSKTNINQSCATGACPFVN